MLRIMFFKGFRLFLKDICGYLYDKFSIFDFLRVVVRKVEMEYQLLMKKLVIMKFVIFKEELDDRFQLLEVKIN